MIKLPALLPPTAMKAETDNIPFRTFEDLTVGQVFPLYDYIVSEVDIIDFAIKYDPQPMHTDPIAAAESAMGGLLASGWHTCAISMRMLYDSFFYNTSAIVSPGADNIRWLGPVRPGDTLSGTFTITKAVESRSKPDRGVVYADLVLQNQRNEQVMTLISKGFFFKQGYSEKKAPVE